MSDAVTEQRTFEFTLCLGRGGFGEVYLARIGTESGLRRMAAVKMLQPGLDPASDAVKRLIDEARLQAWIRHPAVVQVLDLTRLSGRIALITEYVEGSDVSAFVELQNRLPPTAALQVAAMVADALDAVFHTAGANGSPLELLHRDVKPSNIRVGRRGEVKLLDFGIATAKAANREADTKTDQILGSFSYMAPERLSHRPACAASDVYSLAVVTFELLTGTRLFRADPVPRIFGLALEKERFDQHISQALARTAGTLPDGVYDLLRASLSYDPKDRPSAATFGVQCEALAEAAAGVTLRTWCRQHPWNDPVDQGGSLVGQQITESRFLAADVSTELVDTAPLAPSPAAPQPTPPPPATAPKTSRNLPWGLAGFVGVLILAAVSAVALLVILSVVWAQSATPTLTRDPSVVPKPIAIPADADAQELAGAAVEATPTDTEDSDSDDTDSDEALDPDAKLTVPLPDPDVDPANAACSTAALEGAMVDSGQLSAEQLQCATEAMADSNRVLTERDRFGRAAIEHHWNACSRTKNCQAYRETQQAFLQQIGQYDPGMMLRYARHLYDQGVPTLAQADRILLLTRRVLARKGDWTGRTYMDGVDRTHELRANVAAKAWVIAANTTPAKADNRRFAARDTAREWLEVRRQFKRDTAAAEALCTSAAGTVALCLNEDAANVVKVQLTSIPVGATIWVDGAEVGTTPHTTSLRPGPHTVSMRLGRKTHNAQVRVDGDTADGYVWHVGEATWGPAE